MPNLPKISYFSIHEAAEKLGVSTKTLRRWEKAGKLVAVRTKGGHRRYDIASLMTLDPKRRKMLRQSYTSEIPTPIEAPKIEMQPIYTAPVLHSDQIKILKRLSFGFLSLLTLFAVYKNSDNLSFDVKTAKAAAFDKIVSYSKNLPVPGIAKSILNSYVPKSEENPDMANSGSNVQVLAAETINSVPVFNINIGSAFNQLANFAKGLTSTDVATGTLEATGATKLSSTLNVTGATTLNSTLDVKGNITGINGVTYTFPTTQGSSNTFLKNDGAGALKWSSISIPSSLSDLSGVLGISQGGTNNSEAYTTGSIIFSDGTKLAQSASSLFWDDTNKRLGLLTTAPAATLSVGASNQFQVDSTGNITSVNGVTYSFPGTQGVNNSVLTDNGSGTLTWTSFVNNISGTASNGQVTFWNGSNSVSGSSSFTWDDTGKILGTTGLSLTLGSDATGDIYYRNSSGNFARLGIGSAGQSLGVSGGLPSWTGGSGTGNSGFWTRTGTLLSPYNSGDDLTTTGKIGIGSSSAPTYQLDIKADSTTTGNVFNLAYGSLTTLTGNLTGGMFDLDTGNVVGTNQNITGIEAKLPTVTNTNTTGTKTLAGFLVDFGSGSGINQNGAGGTTTYNAFSATMPALTQTAGTLNVNGLYLTTPSSITTAGTASGIYLNASGVNAGSLYGLDITGITGGAGTETAMNIGSGWDNILSVNGTNIINGSGVTQIAGGGTSFSTYTKGDLIYSDATNSLAKLGVGSTGYVLTVSAGGVPTWNVISGSSCSNCLINNPTSDQVVAPTNDSTGLQIRQTTAVSPTHDIFAVTNSTGSSKYFYVDSTGTVNIPSIGTSASDQLTITPGSDKFALKLVGTNVSTQNLETINPGNTSGTIFNTAYTSAKTLTGSLIGNNLDLSTNLTVTNQSVTGQSITLPAWTNTNTSGTKTYLGLQITNGGGINQNGAGGTSNYYLEDLTMPALTQTAGTLTSTGINLTTPSSITTGGTAYGINVNPSGVGAGSLTGLNIGNITGGAGTETGISVGSGWDTALSLGGKEVLTDTVVTTGDVFSATSSAITTGDMIKLGEGGNQTFSGNGILMDFDNTGGGGLAFTGNFELYKNAGTTKYQVDSSGDSLVAAGSRLDAISAGTLNVGTTTANNVTVGNATSATQVNVTSGTGAQTFTSSNATGATTASSFVFTDSALSTGTLMNLTTAAANTWTTGTLLNLTSTATSLTTGTMAKLDWSPGSSTTATGDLMSLNVGANGLIGNIFNVKNNGSSIFAVGQNQITAALPTQFTAAGDIANAYDLAFTNPTSSFIKSNAPLYMQAGEVFNSSDLTLRTFNLGNILLDTGSSSTGTGKVGIGPSVSPIGLLHVSNTNENSAGLIGKAIAIFDQNEAQDILTASAAGVTKWQIGNDSTTGNLETLTSNTATTGNLISATASAITTGSIIKLGEGGNSAFSGNGLFMDFDNTGGGGTAFTGNFLRFDNAATTNFKVDSSGDALLLAGSRVDSIAAGTLNLGTSTANNVTIGNATSATQLNLTSGTGAQTFTSSNATGTTTSGSFVFKDTALTSGDMIYATASAITSGSILKLGQGGNTTFSGNAIFADIDNTGQGGLGFTGNFLKLNNTGSTYLTIDNGANVLTGGQTRDTGTLANQSGGTCGTLTNDTTHAYYASATAATTSDIFYNSTRTKHARITSVANCTNGASATVQQVTLTDAITSQATGDSFTIYKNVENIGNNSSGFFNNVYGVNFLGVTSTLSGGFDLAEEYPTQDATIESGDVVSVISNPGDGTNVSNLAKSSATYQNNLFGVISENPGLTFGNENQGEWRKVALAGRVKVKVTTSNGNIAIGDPLTSSDKSGVAMKATQPGFIVGRAIDNATSDGTVMMIVQPGYYDGGIASGNFNANEITSLFTASSSGEIEKIYELDTTKLNVLGDATLGDTVINGKLNIGSLTIDNTNQSINAIGTLKIQDLALGNIDFMNGLITFDTKGNVIVKTITADKYKVAGTSAGTDKILAGQTSVIINSDQVTDNSLIFVTPVDATSTPLAVTAKTTGTSFKVEIPTPNAKDINFNWWIVDKQ